MNQYEELKNKFYAAYRTLCNEGAGTAEKLKAIKAHHREIREHITADTTENGFIYQMFLYELDFNFYLATKDIHEILIPTGLTVKEVKNTPKLLNSLKKAIKDYKKIEFERGFTNEN